MGHILVEIGKRIAESRRSAGFTQEELANRLGVTPQALSKWEKGASSPDLEMLISLCDILGVSADYLVGKMHFPKVLELLEHEIREKEQASITERIEAVAKQLEREDNFYVVMGRR